jgi:ATP-dependent protease ClpP protease subunit
MVERTPRVLSKKKKEQAEQTLYDLHNYHCNIHTREIFLHGHYNDHEDPGVEYRMATTFEKNMRLLDQQDKTNILVHMHTCGGEWNDGMAMFNMIELSCSPVTILVYSWARSMSSIIPQAADLRILMPDADFMIHYGWYGEDNQWTAAMSAMEYGKKTEERMLRIYAKRCINGIYFQNLKSVTEEKVMQYLDKKMKEHVDWWMCAEEAVYLGFCDGILGQGKFKTIESIRIKRKMK